MENDIIKIFLRERIKENKKLFTNEELTFINDNIDLIKKIYIIGLLNGKN